MAEAAIAAQVHQALDVHRHFAAKITFDQEATDSFTQPFHIGFGKVFHLHRASDTGSVTNLLSTRTPDSIDRGKSDLGMLMVGNVYPSNTGHSFTPKSETLNFNL